MIGKYATFLKIAIEAAIEAGNEILKVYEREDFTIVEKEDQSPLTEADQKANSIINRYLKSTNIPIISEENLIENYEVRKQWTQCWIVDPLDGTKEFIQRNGEFTVNIALVENNQPVLGVIYVPVSGDLYFGDVIKKASYKVNVAVFSEDVLENSKRIYPKNSVEKIKVVGSRSHLSEKTNMYIQNLKKESVVEFVAVGSSIKFCFLAEGEATLYPRFSPTMEWDTCAGDAICRAVGLQTKNAETNKLIEYNKEDLLNPSFIVS
ncbi:3'(2'),5'-bisphosphate nucleotidase CysQ [Joostella sp. CR20]|uniref:3'(2'),5'-bisphosphate nucleotidase CysQ n=1 Tax=Joostella sp. CR20 TaxID=2804312 RepID=UPI00313BA67E